MNRMEEYQVLMEELDREAPELERTLDRAVKKKRKVNVAVRSLTSAALCFVVFVLLVNFCAPVAYACSQVPGLRELAEAVTFSRSLTDAVDHEYVQPIDLTQTRNGITASVEYLIVDQKQVNVFYRLDSKEYTALSADAVVTGANGEDMSFALSATGFNEENGALRSFTIDFIDEDVPNSLLMELKVFPNGGENVEFEPAEEEGDSFDMPDAPEYVAEMEFLLEFDPEFTAKGRIYPVNQTVELDGQQITITTVEVYPTHLRVEIDEDQTNTAWLKRLDFYIETDFGMKFDKVTNGIIATGSTSDDTRSMISYRADSTYFYDAEHLKLVITGAKWLNKDMETMYLNLETGGTGKLPEGVAFVSARRDGADWIVTFRAEYDDDGPMFQLFGHDYYDRDGNEYSINMWSTRQGDPDEEGNFTYFTEEIPLRDYPDTEVWLSPQFSHEWVAEDQTVLIIQ